jgi:hypothetical protein
MIHLQLARVLMSIYTPIKYKQEQLQRWLYSFIPAYIQQVFYIPENSTYIQEIYKFSSGKEWNQMITHEFKEGYYLFTFWNQDKYIIDRIVLHSTHIKTALHIKDLKYLWAFQPGSFIYLLKKYQEDNRKENILDIFLNDTNVYKDLVKYVPSMEISKNITARIVYILNQCEKQEMIDSKQEDYRVKYYTETLEEIERKEDEYLVI